MQRPEGLANTSTAVAKSKGMESPAVKKKELDMLERN
jgi:hypothetical protein